MSLSSIYFKPTQLSPFWNLLWLGQGSMPREKSDTANVPCLETNWNVGISEKGGMQDVSVHCVWKMNNKGRALGGRYSPGDMFMGQLKEVNLPEVT